MQQLVQLGWPHETIAEAIQHIQAEGTQRFEKAASPTETAWIGPLTAHVILAERQP